MFNRVALDVLDIAIDLLVDCPQGQVGGVLVEACYRLETSLDVLHPIILTEQEVDPDLNCFCIGRENRLRNLIEVRRRLSC